ncbi:MAG: hypothetical protein LW817_02745 [Candidatus Caenarcaniphilales bacterium]|jgi:hypothetical protein|nr:hypothetical protein [Candidatus Caenarcaniphilales bacterium]
MEFFDDTVKQAKKPTAKIEGYEGQVELVTAFFGQYTEDKDLDYYKSMIVDLYRAITCYRMYGSIEEFMKINPELEDSRTDIEELWKEFSRLSNEELADVALELLKDI